MIPAYFNKNYIDKINKNNELKKQIEQIKSKIETIRRKLEYGFNYNESDHIEELKQRLKSINTFKNRLLYNSKTKREIELLKQEIESYQEFDMQNQLKKQQRSSEKSELEQQLELLQKEVDQSLPDGLNTYGDYLLFTENDTIEFQENDNNNKDFIVRVCNHFPKDRVVLCQYDANAKYVYEIFYKGVYREVHENLYRHTVHFVLNNVVESTSDGFGVWKDPKFIIIEELEPHKEEFVNLGSDSWTENNLTLSKNAIILVRKDCIDEIPKEVLNEYNIACYEGDYRTCTFKAFKALGIKRNDSYYKNNAGHYNSIWHSIEKHFRDRDELINYIMNNTYSDKKTISFSIEDIYNIYTMYNYKEYIKGTGYPSGFFGKSVAENIAKKYNIPLSFMSFYINFGIYEKNGNYYIKTYDDFYQNFYDKRWETAKTVESSFQNLLNDAVRMYDIIKNFKPKEKEKKYNIKELMDFSTSDLYKFENIDLAKVLTDNLASKLPINTEFVLTPEGCKLISSVHSRDMDITAYTNDSNAFVKKISDDEEDDNYVININIKAKTVQEMLEKIDYYVEYYYENKIKDVIK